MTRTNVAIVTDSNSQLPADLAAEHGISVVPLPLTINGADFLEGVDIDADAFYEFFADGTPVVSTSQPSPGTFAERYTQLAADGATEIVSVHVTTAMSGTLNSARLGAQLVDVPVHLVDSRTASFGVAACAMTVARSLAAGKTLKAAIARGESLAGALYSVTALGAADLLQASGRVQGFEASSAGVDLFRAGPDAVFESIGVGSTADEVCELMAATMHADGAPIRVALAIADQSAAPYYEGLEQRLGHREDVVEIVRYRIGPSVGAFTGPGTAGGFWYSADY